MIANDYRPDTFSKVVGQDSIVSVLKALVKAEGIAARSILIKGPWGSGKTTLSRIFGKAVNCKNFAKLNDVCNECEGCKQAGLKNSRHYIEYDATRVGSVDAIRSMDTVFSAYVEGRRVIVIDEIHTASRQAQSALLKILEEGVKNTFMVFCTTDDVIDTIRSRSLQLEANLIPFSLIKGRLIDITTERNISITDSQLDTIAVKSKGHMRDALQILHHYELAGDEALVSPLNLLRKFLYHSLKGQNVEEELTEIMKFSSQDISNSVSVMVKNFFVSDETLETAIRSKGLATKLFSLFYSPLSQQALKDEVGTEILLRSINEKLKSRGK